MTHMKES